MLIAPQLLREEDFQQQLWFVPDVGHAGREMLESACGIAAVFDAGACPTKAPG